MSLPVCHGKIIGEIVQVTFDSKHDIQTAVNKIYSGDELQLLETTKVFVFFTNIIGQQYLIA